MQDNTLPLAALGPHGLRARHGQLHSAELTASDEDGFTELQPHKRRRRGGGDGGGSGGGGGCGAGGE